MNWTGSTPPRISQFRSGPSLTSGIALERALQVVEVVLHLVGVIVEVEHDAVVAAEGDQLAEQARPGRRAAPSVFGLGAAPTEVPRVLPPSFASRGMIIWRLLEQLGVLAAVPHRPAVGHADHREVMLVAERRDPLDRVGRMQGGVHQLDAVDPGVGHVGEDLIEDRVNVVPRLLRRVDPGMGADDHALRGAGCRSCLAPGSSRRRRWPPRLPRNWRRDRDPVFAGDHRSVSALSWLGCLRMDQPSVGYSSIPTLTASGEARSCATAMSGERQSAPSIPRREAPT